MKKIMVVMAVAMFVFSVGIVFAADEALINKPAAAEEKAAAGEAAEEKAAADEEKKEGIKPFAEVSAVFRNQYVDPYSGEKTYQKPLFSQSAMVGVDRNGIGFYIQAENFVPTEGETKETDFYVGFYTEIKGVKIDAGYGRYWIREKGEVDFNGIYAEITFPAPIWGITPFIKGEYRFAKRVENEDGEGISQNGFVYYVGIRREFQLHERVSAIAEIGGGGNTGIYSLPAENLSFAREKLEIKISLMEWMKVEAKIKASIMTQQNLGLREGIAADTDKLFVSGAIVLTF